MPKYEQAKPDYTLNGGTHQLLRQRVSSFCQRLAAAETIVLDGDDAGSIDIDPAVLATSRAAHLAAFRRIASTYQPGRAAASAKLFQPATARSDISGPEQSM